MKKIYLITAALFLLSSAHAFDHQHTKWNKVLQSYTKKVDNQVLVNYKELKSNAQTLNKYLKTLENLNKEEFKSFSTKEKLSFWINAYNAYTLKIVIDHYPVKSIKDIKSGWFSSGPWSKEFIPLFKDKISLDHIEHEIVRKQFNEPRIHFALNCASIGCPSLLQVPFTATKLEEQLNQSATHFLKNEDKNFEKGPTLHVSKIFKWYGEDFDSQFGSFENYIIQTLNLPKKDYQIKYNNYDWNLNEYSL